MDQFGQLLVSAANIIIAVVLGVLASYVGVWLFSRSTRHLDDLGEVRRGNTAMGVMLAAIIIGLALILKPAIDLPMTAPATNPLLVIVGELLGVVVGLVLGVSAIVFAVGLFGHLIGDIDELAELQKGNVAVAAMMSGVILAVSILISGAVAAIIHWFVTFLAG